MSMLDFLFIAVTWLACSVVVGIFVGRAIALGNRQPTPPRKVVSSGRRAA